MKATCPKDPSHKQFVTVASVMEEWLVDQHGNYLNVIESLQTNHGPDPGNIWRCHKCGSRAEVK